MSILSLLLLLQTTTVPATPGAAAGAPPHPMPQAAPVKRYDEGPLRVEIVAIMEARMKNLDPQPGMPRDSEMRIQFRVHGDTVDKIVRFGNVILTEVVDDTGKNLLRPDQYSESDKTSMRPMAAPSDRLRESGLLLMGRVDAAARGAKALKSLKGSVKIVLAEKAPENVTIDKIIEKSGTLEHDKLKTCGVEVKLISAEEVAEPPAGPGKLVVLDYVKGRSAVKNTAFYDASMRQIRARETELKTKSGSAVYGYTIDEKLYNADMQLVLEVYPQVEEKTMTIDMPNFELP